MDPVEIQPKKVFIKPILIKKKSEPVAENDAGDPSEENDDGNVMVRKLRVMGIYYWVGVKKPYIYNLKTKKKVGFIKEDLYIDWFDDE